MKQEHIGSDFGDFLKQDGLLAECEAGALKRVVAWPIEREMKPLAAGSRLNWHRCGWGSFSAPALAFREGVNVLFPGTEEIQKVHAHVFAGLADAQQDRLLLNPLLSG